MSEPVSSEEQIELIPSASSKPQLIHQAAAPALGEQFEVLELVGTGGMGAVWKVLDRQENQVYAIKTIHKDYADDAAAMQRFKLEATRSANFDHHNIVTNQDLQFSSDGRPFIKMSYIDGRSLAKTIETEGQISSLRTQLIFQQICDGLKYLHTQGVVHGDLKPSNILISKTPSGDDLVHISDFGISKSMFELKALNEIVTATSSAFLSPQYASPEQLLGNELDSRSDIYSLGCILYEMLTGKPPFKESNQVRLVIQQLTEAPNMSEIPTEFQNLVRLCLAKELKERPESIEALQFLDSNLKNGAANFFIVHHRLFPVVAGLAYVFVIGLYSASLPEHSQRLGFFFLASMITFFNWVMINLANQANSIKSQLSTRQESAICAVSIIANTECFLLLFQHDKSISYLIPAVALPCFILLMRCLENRPKTKVRLMPGLKPQNHIASKLHSSINPLIHSVFQGFLMWAAWDSVGPATNTSEFLANAQTNWLFAFWMLIYVCGIRFLYGLMNDNSEQKQKFGKNLAKAIRYTLVSYLVYLALVLLYRLYLS